MAKRVLITGTAGFVATHLLEHILKTTDWEVVGLDRLDTSGNLNRLHEMLAGLPKDIDKRRFRQVFHDLKAEVNDQVAKRLHGPFDYIIHLAAGSHVDRSIDDPMLFFMDNTIGTVNLLNYARNGGLVHNPAMWGSMPFSELEKLPPYVGKFLYFSTDEVYGPAPFDMVGGYKEWDRHNPNNPYAASKSGAEMAVLAFANTYKMPCVITNCMNIIGERQHPEKFIPMVIRKVRAGEKITIHANEDLTQPGMRHYLHARNIAAAVVHILENGETVNREANAGRYNVVGDVEVDNLELAQLIHDMLEEVDPTIPDLNYELVSFHSSRPGHDLRYALDGSKLKDAGFVYPVAFEESLRKTIHWTLRNPQWL
jgi:dTDP-glucose 4,6-dehydratase